jgi:hypothetical protein
LIVAAREKAPAVALTCRYDLACTHIDQLHCHCGVEHRPIVPGIQRTDHHGVCTYLLRDVPGLTDRNLARR